MKILIAIQARSTSSRLPRKSLALIAGKTLIERVIRPCIAASDYLSRGGHEASVVMLCPTGDELVSSWHGVPAMEGPEDDVLTRYALAVAKHAPDLIVRITGDCPLHEASVITRHVKLAVAERYDYISNVDERFRTALDGIDTEVISSKLLLDTHRRATDPKDREHVTLLIRRDPPDWARIGATCGFSDQSGIKMSVDTPEDLERVRAAFDTALEKFHAATRLLGQRNVHRI